MRKAHRKEGKGWGTAVLPPENLDQDRQKVEMLGSKERGWERNIHLRVACSTPGWVPRDVVGKQTENTYPVVSA